MCIRDRSERRLGELANSLDVATVTGSGTSYHILKEAGVQDTDLLIAVTTHDEINLLSCLIASKASGCHTIARVRDPEYVSEVGFIRDELGLSMVINPETVSYTHLMCIRDRAGTRHLDFLADRLAPRHRDFGILLQKRRVETESAQSVSLSIRTTLPIEQKAAK